MSVDPPISTDEIVAGVKEHQRDGHEVRIVKRQPLRIPRGGTGSYFERVTLEIDGRRTQALLKLGRMIGGPPTHEALFYGRYSAESPLRAPRCFGTGPLVRERETWVLMEQLSRGKSVSEWTLDETRQAVRNLAALHAKYMGSAPSDLPRPFAAGLEDRLFFVTQGVRQIRSVFDAYPKLPRFASERAFDLLLVLCARPEVFREAFARSPETLLHGDYHRANLVVRDDEPQVAYDWQHTCSGPPAYDVAVFWNTLGLTTRRGLLGLVDVLHVGDRCMSWEEVKRIYSEALHQLRPEVDLNAIFGCSDEALAWEIARQVMYMGPVMAETQADRLRFVYRNHRTIGGLAIRLLGIENVFRLYETVFAEFEERAERLLKSRAIT